ncbi:13147_t:CDS:2 [Cetraspora pellucida]|uniref:13147_t:CDS:1 n=1 Tax=Cetraspora pellucida TaxID=1433469 RepID=A0A9N9EC15_9GLOM|nr:13147_t:CDS:2 [Cetraspora pellucida]
MSTEYNEQINGYKRLQNFIRTVHIRDCTKAEIFLMCTISDDNYIDELERETEAGKNVIASSCKIAGNKNKIFVRAEEISVSSSNENEKNN